MSSLRRGHANILRTNDYISRIVHVILVQGPRQPSLYLLRKEKLDYTAGLLREIRTFWTCCWGLQRFTLTNAMGGHSGRGRGGDTSGAAPAPSFRPRSRLLAFFFCRPRLLPSLLHEESVCQRRFQHSPSHEVSPVCRPSAPLLPHLCQELRCFSLEKS